MQLSHWKGFGVSVSFLFFSSFESPLMHEVPEHQGSGTDSSASSLGSSVTACKKVTSMFMLYSKEDTSQVIVLLFSFCLYWRKQKLTNT